MKLEEFLDSKHVRKIFNIVYENGPVKPIDFEKKYGFNKYVYEILKKMTNKGILIKTPEGYELSDKFKTPLYDQHMYFERLRKKKEGILWGDRGEAAMTSWGYRPFLNNYTVYGFPKISDLTEYQFQMLYTILKRMDNAFEDLKILKLMMESSKRDEKEIVSGRLGFNYLLHWFNVVLEELFLRDMWNARSFRFMIDLVNDACDLAIKHRVKVCSRSSQYPEKSFVRWFTEKALAMSKLNYVDKLTEVNIPNYPLIMQKLGKDRWFFQNDKKNFICYEKLFEEIDKKRQVIKLDEIMEKINEFEEELAILSTPSTAEMETTLNIKTCLAKVLNKHPLVKLGKPRNNKDKIENMVSVYLAVKPALTLEGFKTPLERKDFENSEILKEHFFEEDFLKINSGEEEIKFLADFIKKYGNSLYGLNNMRDTFLFETYSPGGLWYKKEWDRQIRILEKEFRDRNEISYENILLSVQKRFENEDGEDVEGIAFYLYHKLRREKEEGKK